MKSNKRSIRRHRVERIIKKRLKTIKKSWGESDLMDSEWWCEGRLRKWNLSCKDGCWMCKQGRKTRRPELKNQGLTHSDSETH